MIKKSLFFLILLTGHAQADEAQCLYEAKDILIKLNCLEEVSASEVPPPPAWCQTI